MAVGVLEVIAQAGREGEMVVVGGAGTNNIVKRIMENDSQLPVNVTYPPALISSAIEMTALPSSAALRTPPSRSPRAVCRCASRTLPPSIRDRSTALAAMWRSICQDR